LTDTVAAAKKSPATQDSGRADLSFTARSYDHFLSAGKFVCFHLICSTDLSQHALLTLPQLDWLRGLYDYFTDYLQLMVFRSLVPLTFIFDVI